MMATTPSLGMLWRRPAARLLRLGACLPRALASLILQFGL
jgi:hypothetical protein